MYVGAYETSSSLMKVFYSMHALSGYVSNRSLFDILTQVEMAEK